MNSKHVESCHTKAILEAIGIQSLYWVDDEFCSDKQNTEQKKECLDIILSHYQQSDHEKINHLIQTFFADNSFSIYSGMPEDEVRSYFEQHIDQNNASKVLEHLQGSQELTTNEFQTLKTILEKAVSNFSPMSWGKWQTNKNDVIQERHCMFIIDQSFERETEARNKKGEDIIQDLVENMPDSSYCFLLTHEAKDEQTEEDLRKSIAKKITKPESKARFSVVSKAHLNQETELSEILGNKIKSVYLKKINVDVFDQLKNEINVKLDDLRNEFCQSSAFEIEKIIFASTEKEGASEIDLLKRFIDIKNNLAIADCFNRKDETGLIDKLSNIRKIQTISGTQKPKSFSRTVIENFERYRDYEFFDRTINRLHSPLCVGDIFCHTDKDSDNFFILIAQECDLMIRNNNGKRKAKEVYLVPMSKKPIITPKDLHDTAKQESLRNFEKSLDNYVGHQFHYQLPFKKNGEDYHWNFKLNEAFVANVEILDWCVYNQDGSLCLNPNTESNDMLHLLGWKKKFEKEVELLKNSNENEIPQVYRLFSFCNDSPFVSKDAGELSIPIKRVKRLRAPYKNEIVQRFYAYKARSAFDHDFLKY